MRPLCLWTGARSARAIEITVPSTDRLGRAAEPETLTVLPEHEAEMRAYVDRAQRQGFRLLVGLLGLTGMSILAVVLGATDVLTDTATAWMIGGSVIGMGVLMMAFPLATPETLQAFGARRSMQIARVSGGITVAFGLAIALLA